METIATFPDVASAEAAAALLRTHDIAVQLEPRDAFGQALASGVRLVVPTEVLRRVRWVVANSELADSEYFFRASGELASPEQAALELASDRARQLGPAVAVLGLAFAFVSILFALWGLF